MKKKGSKIFKFFRWKRNLIKVSSAKKKSTHCNQNIKENFDHDCSEEISKYSSSDSHNQANRNFTKNIVTITTDGILADSNELSIHQAENNSLSSADDDDDKLPTKKLLSRNDACSETRQELGDFQCYVERLAELTVTDILKKFENMKSDNRILRDIYESIKTILISDGKNNDLLENSEIDPKIMSKLQSTVRDIFIAHFLKEEKTLENARMFINICKPLTDVVSQSEKSVMPTQLDDENTKISFEHHEKIDECELFEPSKFVPEISRVSDSKPDEILVSAEYVSINNDEQNSDLYRNENFSSEDDNQSEKIIPKKLCRSYGFIDLSSLFMLETDNNSSSKEYVQPVETMEKNVSFDADTCKNKEFTIERDDTAFVFYHHSGPVTDSVKSMNATTDRLHSDLDTTEIAKSEVSSISCEESLVEITATKMLNGTVILPTEDGDNGNSSDDSRMIHTKITLQSTISKNDPDLTGMHSNLVSPKNFKMPIFSDSASTEDEKSENFDKRRDYAFNFPIEESFSSDSEKCGIIIEPLETNRIFTSDAEILETCSSSSSSSSQETVILVPRITNDTTESLEENEKDLARERSIVLQDYVNREHAFSETNSLSQTSPIVVYTVKTYQSSIETQKMETNQMQSRKSGCLKNNSLISASQHNLKNATEESGLNRIQKSDEYKQEVNPLIRTRTEEVWKKKVVAPLTASHSLHGINASQSNIPLVSFDDFEKNSDNNTLPAYRRHSIQRCPQDANEEVKNNSSEPSIKNVSEKSSENNSCKQQIDDIEKRSFSDIDNNLDNSIPNEASDRSSENILKNDERNCSDFSNLIIKQYNPIKLSEQDYLQKTESLKSASNHGHVLDATYSKSLIANSTDIEQNKTNYRDDKFGSGKDYGINKTDVSKNTKLKLNVTKEYLNVAIQTESKQLTPNQKNSKWMPYMRPKPLDCNDIMLFENDESVQKAKQTNDNNKQRKRKLKHCIIQEIMEREKHQKVTKGSKHIRNTNTVTKSRVDRNSSDMIKVKETKSYRKPKTLNVQESIFLYPLLKTGKRFLDSPDLEI